MQDYFELKIKINPEAFEVVSDICFENFICEGVVQAEETYDDTILLTTTEGLLKAYLKSGGKCDLVSLSLPSPLEGEGISQCEERTLEKLGEGLKEVVGKTLHEQRNILLSRGFSDDELGSWEFEISKVENQDWSKKWKENWDVTKVSDKITVVPSWIEYEPKDGEVIITLDPGSAFGTGTHPTTQLCMRAIEKYFPFPSPLAGEGRISTQGTSVRNLGEGYKTIADIGMGSGILAICAVKFGAEFAYGCDNDELVIQTAIENAQINNVSDKCYFECDTADKLSEKYDFVVANILHNVLAEIMGDLKAIMKDGAKLVLSGIMDEKKQVVIDAIKKHELKIVEETSQDVWVAFVVEN